MRLFIWECRRVLQSASYWLFTAALVLFLWSQGALPVAEGQNAFVCPQPGDEQDVLVPSNDEGRVMPDAAAALLAAWQQNAFTTYPPPLCIYRYVRLSDANHAELGALLAGLYGTDAAALAGQAVASTPALRGDLTWADFTAAMAKADRLLGGGSNWAPTGLMQRYGCVPATYQDLLAEYTAGMQNDRYTGGYARLFCDYAVIALALFGALPAVALFLQDLGARRRVATAIWVRRVPGAALVGARCAALLTLQFLPVLCMGGALTVYYAHLHGAGNIAQGAFLRYSVLWLLPTLVLTVTGGALATLLTGTAAGAAVWPALGWASVTAQPGGLSDGSTYGSLLTPRHNTVGKYLVFRQNLPRLLTGRGAALALAAVFLLLAVWVLERRRKGVRLWRFGG